MFLFNGLEQKIMCIDSKSVHRIEWQREEREHSFFIEARKRELLIQASLLHHNVKSLVSQASLLRFGVKSLGNHFLRFAS